MANVVDRGPPSAAAIAIGTAIISGITGYFVGKGASIGLFGHAPTQTAALTADSDDEDSDLSDDDAQDLAELKTFPGNTEECKLVLVVRTDLGMTKGKCTQFTLIPVPSRSCIFFQYIT